MSFDYPTRLQFSRLEAGRAYALAAFCEYGPEELGLGKNAEGNDYGWYRRTRLFISFEKSLSEEKADLQPYLSWQAAVETVIALAGRLSEYRQRSRSRARAFNMLASNIERLLQPGAFDTDGDFETIRSLMRYTNPPDPRLTLRDLLAIADEVVIRNWRNIRRLGDALCEHGVLDTSQLDDHFAEFTPRRCIDLLPF